MTYRLLFDHALTRVDPERAHHAGFAALRAAGPVLARVPAPAAAPVEALGLHFAHPLGLAAGFDKNGVGVDALGGLGFAAVEIGTVTAHAQPGNPRPRLFRLAADRAVVNRMGFNNDGAVVVAARLGARAARLARDDAEGPARARPVLGVNIGKSRVVDEADADAVRADHETTTLLLAPWADYLVVNVSSPNTPGLRSLQAVERLEPLLHAVRRAADRASHLSGRGRVPLLVKLAPDLADDDVLAVADLVRALDVDGVVATNTTIARTGLVTAATEVEAAGAGGLSGPPLRQRALAVTRLLRERLGPGPCVIGVGGITTADDARERLAAGADLLQAYTAFVYEGPRWPRRVVAGLAPAPTAAPARS